MFDIFFGWRKASKCKKLVKRVQGRVKVLRNKRRTIAGLVRDDVAQLILAGHQHTAFNRAEQLCSDLNQISAYELLDEFCEFILSHLSYVRKHKDIPNDINEAISSLIFASARCGDIPELQTIRKLFAERYGQRFATSAVELFPGNLVNHQIIDKLSAKAVPDDVKKDLFDEIVKTCSEKPDLLAIEFASELQKQILEEKPVNDIVAVEVRKQVNYCVRWSIGRECEDDVEELPKAKDSYRENVEFASECSLERACYYCTADDKVTTMDVAVYDVFTYPEIGSKQRKSSYVMREARWNSCPTHVHPKLPDCDHITAQFMALKKDHPQNTQTLFII